MPTLTLPPEISQVLDII